MALNFPNSPTVGQVYTDTTAGFSYEWDGTVWKSYSAASSGQIKVIDDISGSFNGIGKTFALTSNSVALNPLNSASLIINLGGVIQDPSDDYSVSGSNIVFSDAPTGGLTFSGVLLGSAIPVNKIGIESGSTVISDSIGTLNFIGLGNTFAVRGSTIDISISGSSGETYWDSTAAGISTLSNVGIGTTNPTSTLTVDGTLSVSGVSTFYASSGVPIVLTRDVPGAISGFQFNLNNPSGSTTVLSINRNYNGSLTSLVDITNQGVITPSATNQVDFGTSSNRWRTVYSRDSDFSGTTFTNQLNVSGISTFNDIQVGGAVTITGNLTINGTQTIINTEVLNVEDINIGIASTASGPLTNTQLDGAGITIYGSQGDKTLTWDNANSRMAFSTNLYAPVYYGDGSQLTGISAGGIGTEASSGGTVTLDLTAAQDHKVTATGITTITVSGGTEGDSHTVRIVNSGIATVGFSTHFLFPSGSVPSLPTASGAISLISFTVHRVGAAGTQLLAGAGLNYQ